MAVRELWTRISHSLNECICYSHCTWVLVQCTLLILFCNSAFTAKWLTNFIALRCCLASCGYQQTNNVVTWVLRCTHAAVHMAECMHIKYGQDVNASALINEQ